MGDNSPSGASGAVNRARRGALSGQPPDARAPGAPEPLRPTRPWMLTRVYLLLSRLGVALPLQAHAVVARAHYARCARRDGRR